MFWEMLISETVWWNVIRCLQYNLIFHICCVIIRSKRVRIIPHPPRGKGLVWLEEQDKYTHQFLTVPHWSGCHNVNVAGPCWCLRYLMLPSAGSAPENVVFSWSRLLYIHCDTSSVQTDIASWRLAVREGLQNPRIWVSSAYRCGKSAWRSINIMRSAVYRRKMIGPRTDPCGTIKLILRG